MRDRGRWQCRARIAAPRVPRALVAVGVGLVLAACGSTLPHYEDLRVDPETLEVTWSRKTDALAEVRPLYEVVLDRPRGFGIVQVHEDGSRGHPIAVSGLRLTIESDHVRPVLLGSSTVRRQVFVGDEYKISLTEETAFGQKLDGELGSSIKLLLWPSTYEARWHIPSVSDLPAVDPGRLLLVSLLRMGEQEDGGRVFGAVSYGPTGEAVRTASTCTIRPEDPIGTPDPSEGSRYRCSYGPGSAGRASDLLGFPPRIDTAVLSSVESLGTALDPLDLDMVLRHYDNGRLVLRSMRDPAGRWRHDALTYHPLVIEGMLEPLMQRIDYGLGVTSSGSRAP